MKFSWCYGVVLDGNFREQTCKLRNRCAYYVEDLFRRFSFDQLEDDFLLNEPGRECQYFLEREGVRPENADADENGNAVFCERGLSSETGES